MPDPFFARGSASSIFRTPATLGLLTLGLIATADGLFYDHTMGWTAALFGGGVLSAMMLRGGGQVLRGWPGRGVGLATLVLLMALVMQPTTLALLMTGLALVSLAVIDRQGWTPRLVVWGRRWSMFLGGGLIQISRDVASAGRHRRRHSRREQAGLLLAEGSGGAARIIKRRGGLGVLPWLLPVVFSGVFVLLFAWANPVVSRELGRAWRWVETGLTSAHHWLTWGRVGLWLVVGASVWALLRTRVRPAPSRRWRRFAERWGLGRPRPIASVDSLNPADPAKNLIFVGPSGRPRTALIVRCLLLFNAVFAVQTLLDLRYLVGGARCRTR